MVPARDITADATEKTERLGLGVDARAHLLLWRERHLRIAILDEFHGAHETLAANLSHVRMPREARVQGIDQARAFPCCLGNEILILDDLKITQRNRTSRWM